MILSLYHIRLEPAAERFLDKLRDSKLLQRLGNAINALCANPRPPGCKKLRGRPGYRVRVGDYRIIYEVRDAELVILVLEIGDRKDIYR
ncbi:MAG: type II toxin-antitoxin system RelE/ParE family toxin [Verrucomicrobiales bacterium]|jgi:mRNA interferase RelE/StbE|nr:type II toxin-antitoxin system RelE/ParE family toxin [Verrucomicrobiales bacterium]